MCIRSGQVRHVILARARRRIGAERIHVTSASSRPSPVPTIFHFFRDRRDRAASSAAAQRRANRYLPPRALSCFVAMSILLLFPLPTVSAPYEVTAVSLDDDDLERTTVGGLTWRGGIAIDMGDRRFGGLSALRVSRDGQRLTAITDNGNWFQAELEYRRGNLSGLREPRIRPLLDPDGKPLSRPWNDAESLAASGPNGLVVSFERVHRLWRYVGAPDPTAARARPIDPPAEFRNLPNNQGIEAMTRLCDGTLLAIAEGSRTGQGFVPGWILSGTDWRRLRYRVDAGFRPTGAATLPDCDVIFVERRFSFLAGLDIRIVHVEASAFGAGADLAPRLIAQLSTPLTIDNFEGISARRDDSGDTLIYLVSDDNFSPLQRTLLFMFRLDDH